MRNVQSLCKVRKLQNFRKKSGRFWSILWDVAEVGCAAEKCCFVVQLCAVALRGSADLSKGRLTLAVSYGKLLAQRGAPSEPHTLL